MKFHFSSGIFLYPFIFLVLSIIIFLTGRAIITKQDDTKALQPDTLRIHPQFYLLEKALNDPHNSAKAEWIKLNMERWKKVPVISNQNYLLVNIADFHLTVMYNDSVVREFRAIVGRPYRQTPDIYSRITEVEFNPSWVIPSTILRNDVLPMVKRNADYLKKNNIRVFYRDTSGRRAEVKADTIIWSLYPAMRFPYQLVQDPGPGNALGAVKFIFPNVHQVYLHDTPSRDLFEQDERAFSSGCIRVENALQLAVLLLGDGMTEAGISQIVKSGKTQRIQLKNAVPVIIGYFTAWVDRKGVLQIRKDIYHRDGVPET